MKIIVPLAPGFEEIEAVTIIDVLRRANLDVQSAGLTDTLVTGSHGIALKADTLLHKCNPVDYNCIVLPGGMPGSENLKNNDNVHRFIKHIFSKGGYVAAICAAPIVLGASQILYGKKATCFPGFEHELAGATILNEPVVVDGSIITAKGPGCAIPFALTLVGLFAGKEVQNTLKNTMQVYWM
ncbi:MAG: DJ-1/PfpI family protein [Spirochaetes bacterium]|nr:DJ-1/PfpI family protein [Spirochaetota bacterium]